VTGYTKLFSSIVSSTLWREPAATKVVWITMLALADRHGEVEASIPGLAHTKGSNIPRPSQGGAMIAERGVVQFEGHQPMMFKGQKGRILALLLARRGTWVPAPELARLALQYASRIHTIRSEGFTVENRVRRVNGQVRGAYRLIACPGESAQQSIPYSSPKAATIPPSVSEGREA
jgi:hypothetical protein